MVPLGYALVMSSFCLIATGEVFTFYKFAVFLHFWQIFIYENADRDLHIQNLKILCVVDEAEATLATCQVPVHAGDAGIPKAKYKCSQCLIP